jgi:2-methylcitrate dehydratase PrpD
VTIAPARAPAAVVLAEFCADLRWDDLPAVARARAAELVLDLLGVAARGRDADSSRAVEAFVRTQPAGAAWTALLMGACAHATEMDDVTTESSLHPGAAVIPAALALGRETGASGRAALEAIVAGYEVTMRVGNALGAAASYARGFHPTGVAGAFGAAAACAKLLGADIASALGIAGTMASGSLAYLDDGSWTKRLNPAWAAHSGVVAARLAASGFNGPRSAIEVALRGYSDAPRPERLLEGVSLDDLQVMRVSIKPYGCCRYAHGIIDAVLALRAEHRIAPRDVERMRLGVLSGGWSLVADPPERVLDPRSVVDAQFSAPYAAAVALARGRAGLAEFGEAALADPEVRMLLGRIECVRDASLDREYPRRWPAAVEIALRDGRVVRDRVEHALGEPENPLPREALIERFVDMLGRPDARALAQRILALADAPDLGPVDDAWRA